MPEVLASRETERGYMRRRLRRILGRPWLLLGTLFLVCWQVVIATILIRHSHQVGMFIDFDWFESNPLIGFWGMGFLALPFMLVGDTLSQAGKAIEA